MEPHPDDHIIVAMSSGVDSAVSAALYARKYKNVHGIYMANWSQTATCTERDWNDVQHLCRDLNISCERVNFEKEYWQTVFQPMIEKYSRGLTPNPDTGCNKHVKFGKLAEYLEKSYSGKNWWLVTGHYARIMKHNRTGEFHLLRGISTRKDQSYYLSSIPSSIMSKILLPIGHQVKSETRELAKQFDLHVASKPDSQGLCFVGPDEPHFRDFLNNYLEPNPGDIVTEDGKVWGRHGGLWHATIGQKSSISMPQGDPKYKGTWFVSAKDPVKNQLIIVKGRDNPKLYKDHVSLNTLDWIYPREKVLDFPVEELQFQFHALGKPFSIKSIELTNEGLSINLQTSARAMAPGQIGVIYKGNQVLASGIISCK
ncbi:Mitochondrial tRNA-specific 2-thiouridylase 1 [Spathaspora sp. JA1]|nr:Mitochondrial tRNA-specific 2-thiouridylase 1 [Spathaspora sp. JA1]